MANALQPANQDTLLHYMALARVLVDLSVTEAEAASVRMALARHFQPIAHLIGLDTAICDASATIPCAPKSSHVSVEKRMLKKTQSSAAKLRGSAQRGCLHKRGKNPIWYCVVSDDVLQDDGSVKRKKRKIRIGEVSKITEPEARQMMAKIIAGLGTNDAPSNLITVRLFVEQHFKPDVVAHMKRSGKAHYKYLLDRHVLPAIGDMKLRDVNLSHLQRVINLKLKNDFSVQTVKHLKAAFSAVFRHALAMKVIDGFNPAAGIRLPQMVRKEKHTPTPEQVRAVLAVMADVEYQPLREVILLATLSLNYAEIMALRLKRVNLTDAAVIVDGKNLPAYSVAVRENYYRGSFGTLKTRARERIEPLPMVVVRALAALRATSQFSKPEDLMFADQSTGKPLNEDVLRRKLRKCQRRCKNPHSAG